MAHSTSLNGYTAIVTGAGSGINFSFAKLLLSLGCNVICADVAQRPEAAELIAAHSESKGPPPGHGRAVFQHTDVSDWTQLDRLFKIATDTFGGADIVCPGAGVYEPPFSNFWLPPESSPLSNDEPTQSRYKSLDINLTHPIRTTQLAISHFLSRTNRPQRDTTLPGSVGTVVHISSIAAQVSPVFAPLYNASKAGLSHFIHSLAPLERAKSIRVNGVAPGIIKTPIWTDHPEKIKMISDDFDEWVTPEEVAEIMLDCVVKPENSSGTILEVGKGLVRKVEVYNDPGPRGKGLYVPQPQMGESDVWRLLDSPGWGVS